MLNVNIPIPQVENTAVVTVKDAVNIISKKFRTWDCKACVQCPGIALKRAMSAILNPPSRTTLARHAYDILVRSSLAPRARQQYLKALERDKQFILALLYMFVELSDSLKVPDFAYECTCGDNTKPDPEAPDETTQDSDDFMTE